MSVCVGGDRFSGEGVAIMTGVQALVRLPLEQRRADERAGLDTAAFISGYPGSPLGGYDLELERNAKLLAAHRIVHRPAVNEELAATAVMGSQRAHLLPEARHEGVVGYWYGKAPGLDRAGDAMRHGNYGGVARTGGALALVGDDPTAKSSTIPSASEATLAALLMPVLYPGDVQEVLDLGLHGVAMSRCAGVWVGLKMTVNIADGWGIGPRRRRSRAAAPGAGDGRRTRARARPDADLPRRQSARDGALPRGRRGSTPRWPTRAPTRSTGSPAHAAGDRHRHRRGRQVVLRPAPGAARPRARRGRPRRARRPPAAPADAVYPLDGELRAGVRRRARGDSRARGEAAVRRAAWSRRSSTSWTGARSSSASATRTAHRWSPNEGELDADVIAQIVGARQIGWAELPSVDARLKRLRAGPRRRAPRGDANAVLLLGLSAQLIAEGARRRARSAGIGCHGMVVLMRGEEDGVGNVVGLTQMGGEGAQWIGQAPFTDVEHIIQNIGDGTFSHSGSLAIRAAVAAGVNITYKLLWNAHVSMTGGQHAGGATSVPRVSEALLAEGVAKVIVTTDDPEPAGPASCPQGCRCWGRDRIVEAQRALAEVRRRHRPDPRPGVRRRAAARAQARARAEPAHAHVHQRARVRGLRRLRGEVQLPVGAARSRPSSGARPEIHQASCNKDYSCLQG